MLLATALNRATRRLESQGFKIQSEETKTGIRFNITHDDLFVSLTAIRAIRSAVAGSEEKDRKLVVCANEGSGELIVELR